MVSVNITIKKEAYDFLKLRKARNKSFSDVILEMKQRKTPLDFFGVLKEQDWETAEKRMKTFRKSFAKRLNK